MRPMLAYAGVSLAVVIGGGAVLGLVLGGESAPAVWWSAAVAYAIQLGAFALLLAGRRRKGMFLVGMVGGMGSRLVAVIVAGVWVTRTEAYPAAALLVSLVGFLFLLLLLEPVFIRKGSLAT
jgi:hypothetical protein